MTGSKPSAAQANVSQQAADNGPACFFSLLFAPAHESAKAAKALAGAGKQVALDWEAAVPDARKAEARAAVGQLPVNGRKPFVRVNGLQTPWADEDFASLPAGCIAGIILPLVGARQDLLQADELMAQAEKRASVAIGSLQLMPIIETCRGLAYLGEILRDPPERLQRVSFGAWDFTLDSGIRYTRTEEGLALARQLIVVHSKAAGLQAPIDASYPYLNDSEGMADSCRRARLFGFAGKACIHPAQVDIANRIFAPDAAEIEYSAALIQAYEEALADGRAAARFRGAFIDRPMYDRARLILQQAEKEVS